MQLYDSHCHLEALSEDFEHKLIVVPMVSLNDMANLVAYRTRNHLAKIGVGLHPWYIDEVNNLVELEQILRLQIEVVKPNFIGECGLDKLKPNFELQQQIFELQLKLALEYDLPVIIHCVRAYNEVLAHLKKYSKLTGVIHGYNANREIAKQFAKYGFYLGVGSVILNQSSQLVKSIANIPLEQLMIESDAPYMPMNGKSQSSSADCLVYADKLAQLKNKLPAEIISELNRNWLKLFN